MDHPKEFPPNPKVEAIISDITQLMNEAEQMLCDSTSHHAEPQVALLRSVQGTGSVPACFGALCTSAGRAIADRARRADRCIRESPYQSLAIALGAGVLFGMAFTRRDA